MQEYFFILGTLFLTVVRQVLVKWWAQTASLLVPIAASQLFAESILAGRYSRQ